MERASPATRQVSHIQKHNMDNTCGVLHCVFGYDACVSTGRCISPSLRCNGEIDCADSSDEEGCSDSNSREDKCSTLMPIPGAERGTQG